jgi:hypothetical protein
MPKIGMGLDHWTSELCIYHQLSLQEQLALDILDKHVHHVDIKELSVSSIFWRLSANSPIRPNHSLATQPKA